MNRGIIAGYVSKDGDSLEGAIISLRWLVKGWKNATAIPIYNEDNGRTLIHNVYTDRNGYYQVPFMWDAGVWYGESIAQQNLIKFQITAIDDSKLNRSKTQQGVGKLKIGVDLNTMVTELIPHYDKAIVLQIKKWLLASAAKTAFSIRPSTNAIPYVAMGEYNFYF